MGKVELPRATQELKVALKNFAAEVQKALLRYPREQLEVEIRMGTFRDRTFRPGIKLMDYQALAQKMQVASHWEAHLPAAESYTYHFKVGDKTYRSEIQAAPSPHEIPTPSVSESLRSMAATSEEPGVPDSILPGLEGQPGKLLLSGSQPELPFQMKPAQEPLEIKNIEKIKLSELNLLGQRGVGKIPGMDLRITLSLELPVQGFQMHSVVLPRHVRIRQRNSYLRRHWRYDLSLTWSGGTREKAEIAQRVRGGPQTNFEVEAELDLTSFPGSSSFPSSSSSVSSSSRGFVQQLAKELYCQSHSLLLAVDNLPVTLTPLADPK